MSPPRPSAREFRNRPNRAYPARARAAPHRRSSSTVRGTRHRSLYRLRTETTRACCVDRRAIPKNRLVFSRSPFQKITPLSDALRHVVRWLMMEQRRRLTDRFRLLEPSILAQSLRLRRRQRLGVVRADARFKLQHLIGLGRGNHFLAGVNVTGRARLVVPDADLDSELGRLHILSRTHRTGKLILKELRQQHHRRPEQLAGFDVER